LYYIIGIFVPLCLVVKVMNRTNRAAFDVVCSSFEFESML